MVNYSQVLTDTWFQISNNQDYMLQNNSDKYVHILAGTSTAPTSTADAFKLPAEGVVTSSMLSGIIWARSSSGNQLVIYSK